MQSRNGRYGVTPKPEKKSLQNKPNQTACNSAKPLSHSFLHSLFSPLSIMSIEALKLQLHNFIRSMCDEGLVNEQFLNLQDVTQYPLRREALIRAIITYSLDAKQLFSAITTDLDQQLVDFDRVRDLARDFYIRTCNIGAEGVKRACAELIQASERKDKNYCSLTLYWTKHRFGILRSKFETVVKMERCIIDLENNQ